MKNKYIIISVTIILLFVIIYYNDACIAYNIQKRFFTQLELIKYYTSIQFSDNTSIECIKFESDNSIIGDEYMKAYLRVPSDEVNTLFPEDCREYENNHMPSFLFSENDKEKVYFSVFTPQGVKKWFTKTQRSIHCMVLNSEDGYTKIYVSVDKLGWWLSNKKKLGGFE